jgi:PPOX class probable F420-dependent enzyme
MTFIQRLAAIENRMLDRVRSGDATKVADATPTGRLDDLRGKKYCILVSYKKDGNPVPSPLWFGLGDGKVYVHTGGYKIKRMERNPHVLVAPSSFRGKPLGAPFAGTARILPQSECAEADRCLDGNYGLQRRAYLKLFGQSDLGEYVEITPDPPA